MSYARMVEGVSDVYLFHDVYGGWDCCGCPLHVGPGRAMLWTIGAVLDHMQEHLDNGDLVPGYALERIRAEIDEHGRDWDGEDRGDDAYSGAD